jgi:hypothetical protein
LSERIRYLQLNNSRAMGLSNASNDRPVGNGNLRNSIFMVDS